MHTAQEIVESLGYDLTVAPENAVNVVYNALVLKELTVGETVFEGGAGKIVWFDAAPGLLYSFYMESGASEAALLEMASLLFAPAKGDVG